MLAGSHDGARSYENHPPNSTDLTYQEIPSSLIPATGPEDARYLRCEGGDMELVVNLSFSKFTQEDPLHYVEVVRRIKGKDGKYTLLHPAFYPVGTFARLEKNHFLPVISIGFGEGDKSSVNAFSVTTQDFKTAKGIQTFSIPSTRDIGKRRIWSGDLSCRFYRSGFETWFSGENDLIKCLGLNDLDCAQRELDAGRDINHLWKDGSVLPKSWGIPEMRQAGQGFTPLTLADPVNDGGDRKVLYWLLSKPQIDPNQKTSFFGESFLRYAIEWNHPRLLNALLANPRINQKALYKDGEPPLFSSWSLGDWQPIAKKLLDDPRVDLNVKDVHGDNLADKLLTHGNNAFSAVDLIKQPRFDVSAKNKAGKTIIDLAQDNPSLLMAILGARSDIDYHTIALTQKDLLFWAAKHGNISRLLSGALKGVDLNQLDEHGRSAPMYLFESGNGSKGEMDALLHYQPNLNLDLKDNEGQTIYTLGAKKDNSFLFSKVGGYQLDMLPGPGYLRAAATPDLSTVLSVRVDNSYGAVSCWVSFYQEESEYKMQSTKNELPKSLCPPEFVGPLVRSNTPDLFYVRLKKGTLLLNAKTGLISKVNAFPANLKTSRLLQRSNEKELRLTNGIFDLNTSYLTAESPVGAQPAVTVTQRGTNNSKTLLSLPAYEDNSWEAVAPNPGDFVQIEKNGALLIYPNEEQTQYLGLRTSIGGNGQGLYLLKAPSPVSKR